MTTNGEAPVATIEGEPHLDLSFVSPEAMDALREEQYKELNNASLEALLDAEHWRDAITPEMGIRSNAQQRIVAGLDEAAAAYVERHLDSVPPDARDLVRKVAVAWVIKCSVHRMNDEEWYLGKVTSEGQHIQPGWEYLEERLQKLVATYEGHSEDVEEVDVADRPDEPAVIPVVPQSSDVVVEDQPGDLIEEEPLDEAVERGQRRRRFRDLPLLGAIAVTNGFDRLRDRLRRRHVEQAEEEERHRRWPYAVVAAGGLALAGAGLYLLLDRAGAPHHILVPSHPGPTPHPLPHPTTPPPIAPRTGHQFTHVPRGTEVFGPAQTSELTRNWAAGSNARHILHFVSEGRGHVTLQLENVAPDGTIINGHAVDLTQAAALRANITVNVGGNLNTISVPMHGDSLDLNGKLAKLIQSGKFSTVEVVRQHGDSEQVFSTVTGNGHSISTRAFRSYLGQVQQHQQVNSSGAGGNRSPHNTVSPPAPHKTPPPTTVTIPAEKGESPNDDTGFWHNPIVDGVMIASGLAIAGGAAVADSRNRRRTVEEVEENPPPRPVGLDILHANGVSLPAEREQAYAEQIQSILHEEDTSWIQPGRSREEYISDFTPVAERAVDELGDGISAQDRNRLVVHLVKEYCAGSPDEIYERLSGLHGTEDIPEVR